MTDNKKSFVLYSDSLDILDKLSNDDIAELFIAIRDYHNGKELSLSPLVDIAFSSFESAFKRDKKKYDKKCQQLALNASRGGKKVQENNKLKANASKCSQIKRDSVNDNVSDSDSVSDSDNTLIPYQDSNYSVDGSTGEIINFPLAGRGEF